MEESIEHCDRADPEIYRQMLACGLGSDDPETLVATECRAGCTVAPTFTHALA